MLKSSEFRPFVASMTALLLTFTFVGGAYAQAGAAAARVFGTGASAAVRASSATKGLLAADVVAVSSASRARLGAIDTLGSGNVLVSKRLLSLRGTNAVLPQSALAKLCDGDAYASESLDALLFRQSGYHTRAIQDREDLVQDAMVRLLEACTKLKADPSINVPRYLSRVMQHAAADSYAKQPNASVVSMSDLESSVGVTAANIADPWPDPAAMAELRDLIQKVWNKTVLSPRQAQVLQLVASGYSRDEVALRLDMSEERVKEVLAEGRLRLRATIVSMKSGRPLSRRGVTDTPQG